MKDNPAFNLRKLTVGPAGSDVAGFTGAAVQLAVDAIARRGGGTVELHEGSYELAGPIRLADDIALLGRGDVTLRRREGIISSDLAIDADIGQMEITPAHPQLFRAGMGICLYDSAGWAYESRPLTVTAVEGGRLLVHQLMTADRLAERGGRVVNYFPLVLLEEADRCLVDNLAVDGRAPDDACLEGLWGAGVYLFHSRHCTISRVRVWGVRGDGIRIADASNDAAVEDCQTKENTHYGVHPGSHSARSAVRRCHVHHNGSDGLYICWGVKGGRFEENDIHHNGWRLWRSGFSIGHKDTDCLIARNHIHENCKYGVCIRRKTEANGAHRGVYRDNLIEDNGQDPAGMPDFVRKLPARELVSVGVSVQGLTHDLIFERNVIRETRPPGKNYQKNAFYIGPGVSRLTMCGNQIAGHPDAPIVDESGALDYRLQ